MINKILLLSVSIMLIVSGCSNSNAPTSEQPTQAAAATEEAKLDLNGEWIQSDADSSTVQTATIANKSIEIYWLSEDDTKALYWAGSVADPEKNTNNYEWDSVNDKSKTDGALLASPDDTKHFEYKDGKISYEVSAMGVTKKVTLEKQK